ncbi:helix-turn-helix domain-containing protein [Cupriavidus basilensis]
MLNASHTVEAIASRLGFSSASAFTAMFHRLMGMPPDEFRHRKGALTRPKV